MAFGAADLVLSRAGAGTISELEIVGKACILVPSPNVAEDHQTHNAKSLVKDGAAEMIVETELDATIDKRIQQLILDKDKRQKLSNALLKRAKPHSTKDIVDTIETLIAQ
jgi:UDP-N-acetylglucosamine--N-acetylmuramyl-(pentapeptide) pyrophosphoryl-undecaprenol N-acetylglucosamine transferase